MSDASDVERRMSYRIEALEERIVTLEKLLADKKETGALAHEGKPVVQVCRDCGAIPNSSPTHCPISKTFHHWIVQYA